LLALAVKEFDVFITIDRHLTRDHRPPAPLAIVGLTALDNRVETVCALVPEIMRALERIRPSDVARVGR